MPRHPQLMKSPLQKKNNKKIFQKNLQESEVNDSTVNADHSSAIQAASDDGSVKYLPSANSGPNDNSKQGISASVISAAGLGVGVGAVSGVLATKTSEPDPLPPPPAATYAVSSNQASVDEGSSLRFTITGTNAVGKSISYQLKGGAATPEDLSTPLSGSVNLDSNGVAYVDVSVKADEITEGEESLQLVLSDGQSSATVSVVDSSKSPNPPPTPVYAVSAKSLTVNEGGSVIFEISGTQSAGKSISYQLVGSAATLSDLASALTGSVKLDDYGKAYVEVSVAADKLTEGIESINLMLSSGEKSATDVRVDDTSLNVVVPVAPPPTYAVSSSVASIDEGGLVRFTIRGDNATGLNVSYKLSGSAATVADLSSPLSGLVTLDSSGIAYVDVVVKEDASTEGAEEIALVLAGGQSSSNVTINDTSIPVIPVPIPTPTPPQPLPSSVAASTTSVDEGKSITFTITDANKVAGQKVTWSVNPERAGDIEGATSGAVTIDQTGKAIVTILVKADATTETAPETLTFTVGSQTVSATINDTSQTPVASYTVSADKAVVDEGGTLRFTILGTNASNNVLNYQLLGSAASTADINSPLTGTVTLDINGTGYVDVVFKSDGATEGPEYIEMVLSGGQQSGIVTVNDTSTFA